MMFPERVRASLAHSRCNFAPVHSAHEALGRLMEAVVEVQAEVFKKADERCAVILLAGLVELASLAQTIAEDLCLCER